MPDATTPAGQYVVVARRYRPQTFADLIGQEHVAQALSGAIASGRVGHAYLFTGARGVGKTSAARILAKALDCVHGPTATPCNQCEICTGVSTGDDVDVLEIDGASNRGIDEIRQLRQNVAVRPSRARFKIYIIDEVHMLTKEAFNALLKTLEEPPEHVKFIFATTEPNKIPITILSRCQRYDFAGIESGAIHKRLAEITAAEGVEAEPEALQIIAIRAAGSMRDSQSLLEQLLATGQRKVTAADVTSLLGLAPAARLNQIVQPLVERNAAAALAEFDSAIGEGAEVGQLVDQLLGYFRDAMALAVGCRAEQMLYALPGQQDDVRAVADRLGVETLLAISQVLDQAAARMRISTQVRTLAEMAIVRICRLENLDALAALIEQLKSGQPAPATNVAATAVKKNSVGSPPRPHAFDRQPQPARAAVTTASAPRTTSSAPPAALSLPAELRNDDKLQAVSAGEQLTATSPLDSQSIEHSWKQVLDLLPGALYGSAAAAERVELSPDGRLILSFPSTDEGKFARDRCQRALPKIEAAVAENCGRPIPLSLELHQPSAGAATTVSPSPRAKLKEMQSAALAGPFVQKAMELFASDPTRARYVPPEEEG